MKVRLTGILAFAVVFSSALLDAEPVSAHCQVPCGIYDDPARITALREDHATIAKAMGKIRELSGKHDAQSLNQFTRWVTTKDAHASNVIAVMSEYFLAQKVKPVAAGSEGHDGYLAKLADHHAVIVAAMKTKQQTTDEAVAALATAIDQLGTHYTP